jgi:hypothetical protein
MFHIALGNINIFSGAILVRIGRAKVNLLTTDVDESIYTSALVTGPFACARRE